MNIFFLGGGGQEGGNRRWGLLALCVTFGGRGVGALEPLLRPIFLKLVLFLDIIKCSINVFLCHIIFTL